MLVNHKKNIFPLNVLFLVTFVSFLLLVNVEFLIISSTLRFMHYGSVEGAAITIDIIIQIP